MAKPATMVDPRQPRLGQAITGIALLLGFVADWPMVMPLLAVILAGASLLGPRFNAYAYAFRALMPWFGPPRELEEAAPPRFANTLGFIFLALATFGYFAFDPPLAGGWVSWVFALLVSGLALLAATTGLCVGCELFVWARRIATGGRIRGRLTAPVERAEAGASG